MHSFWTNVTCKRNFVSQVERKEWWECVHGFQECNKGAWLFMSCAWHGHSEWHGPKPFYCPFGANVRKNEASTSIFQFIENSLWIDRILPWNSTEALSRHEVLHRKHCVLFIWDVYFATKKSLPLRLLYNMDTFSWVEYLCVQCLV